MTVSTSDLLRGSPRGRLLAVVVTVVLGLALALAAIAVPAPPAAAQDVTPARVTGEDRVDTAAEVALATYTGGTNVALLARADDFPDALASAALAGQVDAPVLLTETEALSPRTEQVLETLGVTDVFILGGNAAISVDVEARLLDLGYTIERLAGPTRYGTAAVVAAETVEQGPTDTLAGGARTVFIAYGGSFEDALSAGAPASAGIIPTLLTDQDSLPDETIRAIRDLDFEYAYVLGGQLAVSSNVVEQLESLGLGTQRIAGQTAQGTAAAIANAFDPLLEGPTAILARGDVFADALSAGPHAGVVGGPILLTVDPNTLGDATSDWFAGAPAEIEAVRAIGGRAAITAATLQDAVDLVAGAPVATDQTYLVSPQEVISTTVPGTVDFLTTRRYDGGDIAEPVLDVALLPCDQTDVTGSGADTFNDDDNDGVPDGFGATDTGNAAIAALNGFDVADEDVKNNVVVRDGRVTWRLASVVGPDCTTTVVFDDTNGDGVLNVDVSDVPVEPYGVGVAVFQ